MNKVLVIITVALALSSCEEKAATLDECVIQNMNGIDSDVAARAVIRACENMFPAPPNFFDQFDGMPSAAEPTQQ